MNTDDVETGSKNDTAPQPSARAIWLPVSPAISWVAFGAAEELWSEKFYFGASAWAFLTPADVVAWLDEVAKYGAAEPASIVEYEINLMPAIYRRAEAFSPARIADDNAIRAAAAEARQKLVDGLADATEQYRQIWNAAERLRLALAKEEIKAFGWRGEWPSEDEPRSTDRARTQIPPTVFAAPVTLTHRGLLPFIKGDPIDDGWTTLWHGIRIHADDLLKLRPAPQGAPSNIPYADSQAERPKGGKGGRPSHPVYKAFVKEMIRVADLDSLTEIGGEHDPKEEFRAHMRAWLRANFKDNMPGDTTIRGWVDELWPTPQEHQKKP
ncbi:MAG: hypothetical protein RLZZ187_2999 [Pseudomonadota bacterium]|jgi:hypothetical protein